MRKIISRWFMFGLLVGWAVTHATVFGQPAAEKTPAKAVPAIEKLRANLDKNITIDFTGQSLVEVLNHFKDKTGIAINVDQFALMQMNQFDGGFPGGGPPGGPGMQVQVKATNEKAGVVLRRLLTSHQLAYVIFEDAVLVTSEEAALVRQMRQRVSVDVDEVPFNKAVRTLARNHGVNLVIDPKVKKQAETAVTLQLEDTGIETTVRLLAELASLKAVRMGNVMFITTEEKAKKIREEEPNQFDNPFNPNVPMPATMRGGIGIGGIVGGGFGGIGGGIMPMPGRVVPAVPLPDIAPQRVPVDPAGVVPPPPPKNAPKGEPPQQPDRPVQSPPRPGATTPPPPPLAPQVQRPRD